MRVVQLTPPGSSCAIVFGAGWVRLPIWPQARSKACISCDVDDMGGVLYSYFSDPDGNMWALQQWPAGCQV
jgi:hypothetical protein